jgi:Spy/CpxP family protein refolding chaperone
MKKVWIAATALLLITGSLQAQTNKEETKTAHHKGIHGKNGMAHLNLSDDQKAKLKELNAGYRKQFADLKGNADSKEKIAALRKEQHEKMQALLTPEQKTQLAEQRKNGRQGMKGDRGKGGFDRMKTQLGLTDEQAKKIKDSQAGVHEKIKSIHQDQTLSDSQKKEQVRAIMKQQHETMKSVLTPEQLQKMKNGRKGRKSESVK